MALSPRRLAIAGSLSLIFSSSPLLAADPPNIPVSFTTASVDSCTSKGVISLNLTDVNTDVPSIRSPEMRLHVAKLGGNVVLILPSGNSAPLPAASDRGNEPRQVHRIVSATVYACPAAKLPKPPARDSKG
jgi:hypothetical protein